MLLALATSATCAWWWVATAPCWALAANWRRYGVPLIGINQGGWASSPTFRLASIETTLAAHAGRRL